MLKYKTKLLFSYPNVHGSSVMPRRKSAESLKRQCLFSIARDMDKVWSSDFYTNFRDVPRLFYVIGPFYFLSKYWKLIPDIELLVAEHIPGINIFFLAPKMGMLLFASKKQELLLFFLLWIIKWKIILSAKMWLQVVHVKYLSKY